MSAAVGCLMSDCSTPEQAHAADEATGAALGGGAGAVAGYFLGQHSGNGALGAVGGAVAGAALGAGIADRSGADELFKSRQLKFQEAVLKGNIPKARRYFDSKFVNLKINGYPPIYYAATNGDIDMARLLLQAGASPRYRADGKSLAYLASANGHPQCGESLIALGAGTSRDVQAGGVQYAEESRQQRERNAVATAAALTFVATAMHSAMTSSGATSDEDREAKRIDMVNAAQEQQDDYDREQAEQEANMDANQ